MTPRQTLAYLMSLPENHIVDIGHGRRVTAAQAIRNLLDSDPVEIQPAGPQIPMGQQQAPHAVPSRSTVENLDQDTYDRLASGEGIEGFTKPATMKVYRRQSGTTHVSHFRNDKEGLSHSSEPSYGVERGPDGAPRLPTGNGGNRWGLLDGDR